MGFLVLSNNYYSVINFIKLREKKCFIFVWVLVFIIECYKEESIIVFLKDCLGYKFSFSFIGVDGCICWKVKIEIF